jgi:uncharacterized caspase-like protein
LDFRVGILIGFSAFRKKSTQRPSLRRKTIIKIAQQYHIKTSAIYELNPEARKELNLNQRFNSKFSQRNSKTTNNPTAKYTKKHMQFCLKKQSMV